MRRLFYSLAVLGLSVAGVLVTAAPAHPSAVSTIAAPTVRSDGYASASWSFSIEGATSHLHPGDSITIDGTGVPIGTTIDTVLHSTPIHLGSVTAGADGRFRQTVQIPTDIAIGHHLIIVTVSGPNVSTTSKQAGITVTAGARLAITGGNRTIAAAIQPNILTEALTPIADVAAHPVKIVSAIEIGLVLLFLAVLPAHLLNATLAEQSDRFERRLGRLRRRPLWMTRLNNWFSTERVVAGILVTVVGAVLFGFADPKFGFTLASLRLVLACRIALFLVGYVASALTAAIARTQWHITVLVSTRPYGLLLTLLGVLLSRLLHFSPGFLIGLILGLTIQGKSEARFAWRTVVTRTCILLAMSAAAWIGYSTIALGGNEGGSFGTALMVETLVAVAAEATGALLVELLPFRFLEGARVYAHSRILWAVLYFLTIVVFVLAVVPWQGNWDALGASLWIWVLVLALFAALCVGVYAYFRRFAAPLEAASPRDEVALGETLDDGQIVRSAEIGN